jgi:hypothetical protein
MMMFPEQATSVDEVGSTAWLRLRYDLIFEQVENAEEFAVELTLVLDAEQDDYRLLVIKQLLGLLGLAKELAAVEANSVKGNGGGGGDEEEEEEEDEE